MLGQKIHGIKANMYVEEYLKQMKKNTTYISSKVIKFQIWLLLTLFYQFLSKN